MIKEGDNLHLYGGPSISVERVVLLGDGETVEAVGRCLDNGEGWAAGEEWIVQFSLDNSKKVKPS